MLLIMQCRLTMLIMFTQFGTSQSQYLRSYGNQSPHVTALSHIQPSRDLDFFFLQKKMFTRFLFTVYK